MQERRTIKVDEAFKERAAIILNDLWDEVCSEDASYIDCRISHAIDFVLRDGGRTWPYILMTQLLGKATDERVNILSMHKSCELDGAWDARCLCEDVITKDGFEAAVLRGVLGGVKQPYNNSPGQKPFLSKSNRAAKSFIPIRDSVIDALLTVRDSHDAKQCLGYFLRVCLNRLEEVVSEDVVSEDEGVPVGIARFRFFLTELARKGRDGEGLSIAIALAMEVFFKRVDGYEVLLYPINSSRKHGGLHQDLEVYLNLEKFAAFEIKDKPFADSDVISAAEKAWEGGFSRFGFIYGYGAGSFEYDVFDVTNRAMQMKRGSFAECVDAIQFIDSLLLFLGEIDCEQIRVSTVRLLDDARVKARTQTVARNLLREFLADVRE